MATTTETRFRSLSIVETALAQEPDDRTVVPLRSDLDLGAFGARAVRAATAGIDLVREHDEVGPGADGHEELYLVLAGHAAFTVDGEDVDAPHGTVVFVRDPAAKRAAVAKEDGTIVVAVGGRRGEGYRLSPGMRTGESMFPPYEAKDYEAALAVSQGILDDFPGNGLALYNIACMEALLGRPEDALTHLAEALAAAPTMVENARTDDDFASLRGDERFEKLVAN